MQHCCKTTFANSGFCAPAAKLHFHKKMCFLHLFRNKKGWPSKFQQEEREQRCNYLHGFIQSLGEVQLFVFKALDWNKRGTE